MLCARGVQVMVLSKGVSGYIGVGYQTEEVLLSRLPGWDPHSYGEQSKWQQQRQQQQQQEVYRTGTQ